MSEVLQILTEYTDKFKDKVAAYLRGLAGVKRFPALAMFLNSTDKQCKYPSTDPLYAYNSDNKVPLINIIYNLKNAGTIKSINAPPKNETVDLYSKVTSYNLSVPL